MKASYFYYIVTTMDNGKFWADVVRVPDTRNLFAVFNGLKKVQNVTPCATLKRAQEIAKNWNKKYIDNGTALLDARYNNGYTHSM